MPEFSVGGGSGSASEGTRPLLASVSDFILLPRLGDPKEKGTPENIVITEIGDQLNGRSGNSSSETKGIQKAIEKGLRLGRIREAFLDVLFGDTQAGAPDPAQRSDLRLVDEQGRTFTMNAEGDIVEVKMLPVWERDP